MIGEEETTALPGIPPLCCKGSSRGSTWQASPRPAHQNMAVSWQISPWKATAEPAAHTWHHFSCLYPALPWGLHTLCQHSAPGSARLWGHQKVHRVRSWFLLLTHTWLVGLPSFMSSQSTALSLSGHDPPRVPKHLHTSTLKHLPRCVRAITSSGQEEPGQEPTKHSPTGPHFLHQKTPCHPAFQQPTARSQHKTAPFSEKKANSSRAESPGALRGVGSLPGRAQAEAPAGVATHTLCSRLPGRSLP